MAGNERCNSCDRQRPCRRVELFLQADGGGVQAVTVRLCRACTAALIDSVTLFAIATEFLDASPPVSRTQNR